MGNIAAMSYWVVGCILSSSDCMEYCVRVYSMALKSKIAFCWCGLCPAIPLEGRITANACDIIVTDHLYPLMKLTGWLTGLMSIKIM